MRRAAAWTMAIAAATGGSALGGCADLTRATSLAPAQVNPESPVAPAAIAASKENYAYPRFSDVPSRPKDIRSPAQMKAAVVEVARDKRGLDRWATDNPPLVGGTDAYAAQTRGELSPEMMKPVDAEHARAMEAYAERERQQGAAPPPMRAPPPGT